MPLWPFARAARRPASPPPTEETLVLQDLLRRNVEDVLAVAEQAARGHAFIFGGELRVEPARAREILEPRLQALGFTPFLSRDRGHVWIQALPLGETTERPRPALALTLFLATLLSTLAAGSMVSGSFPWLTFDPVAEPGRLLDGLPFAFTLLAILGTHEFGHAIVAQHQRPQCGQAG